jgi:hypothetical protein
MKMLNPRWWTWGVLPLGGEPPTAFIPYADPDPLQEWGATLLNEIAIAGMKAAATVCWELEKVGAGITRFLIQQDMWEVLLDSVMNSLRTVTPTILRDLVFGAQGGGLFYLALMLAGIFMIIPQLGKSRLVDAGHAMVWLALIVTLFISSTAGFDLIQAIEGLRADTVGLLNPNEGASLDDLIARPMLASESDLLTYELVLPGAFRDEYFTSERESESAEILWGLEVSYETQVSRERRSEAARTGIALAALTLFPGITLLLFGMIFATLTASALVLITFFIVALPLGFFEFGSHILMGIARQYVYLWAITLLAVVLPSILRAAGTLTYPTSAAPSLTDLVSFIPVLIIVTIATSYVSAMATRTLTDTLHVVNTSVRGAMAPMAQYTGLPVQDSLSRAGQLLGHRATGVGEAAGNISASTMTALVQSRSFSTATAAGAGAFLGNLNPKWGQAAAILTRDTVASPRGDVFAVAAENPAAKGMVGTAQVATTAYHARYGRRTRRNEFLSTPIWRRGTRNTAGHPREITTEPPTQEMPVLPQAAGDVPTRVHPTVEVSPTGADLIMPTPYGIQQAHSLMVRGNEPLARADYHRLFGDAGLAEDLVNYHRAAGVRGMNLTQAVVAQTQAVVAERMQAGTPFLNAHGEVIPRVKTEAVRRLNLANSPILPEEMPLMQRVMERSVYASHTPASAIAPYILNPGTLQGEHRDVAAYYALHDIARAEGWTTEVVRDVLEATYHGHASAETDGANPRHRTARLLQQLPELRTTQGGERAEIARLAHLVLLDHTAHYNRMVPEEPRASDASMPNPEVPSNPSTLAHSVMPEASEPSVSDTLPSVPPITGESHS